MEIGLAPALGEKPNLAVLDRSHRGGHGGIAQEPLLAEVRLDGNVAALAVADAMGVIFRLEQKAEAFHFRQHGFARLHAVQAGELRPRGARHRTVGRDNNRQRQVVAQRHFVVGGIVGGSHFDTAGAELRIDQLIENDGNGLVAERQEYLLAAQILVARVLGMHRHGFVAQHRFRAGGGDDDKAVRASQGIFEVPKMPLLLDHIDLLIGEGGLGGGVPIDHALAAIDQGFIVKLDEHFLNAERVLRVHGETLAGPIAGSAQHLELLDDDAAVLLLPLPHFLQELLAAEVVAGFHEAEFAQILLDNGLRGNAGVVRAGQPQHFAPLHAGQAGQDVLDGVVEDVPQGEHAGDVGGRNDNGVGRLARQRIGDKALPVEPELAPFLLNGLGFVGFGNFGH